MMKKLINLCFTLLLALVTVFCIAACADTVQTPNDGHGTDNAEGNVGTEGTDGTEETEGTGSVLYEITVDAKDVSGEISGIQVCLYALNGTKVKEEKLTDGQVTFEMEADSYVATLSGLEETVNFSSVLLTKNNRKATIALTNSKYDDLMEYYTYTATLIFLSGEYRLKDLSAQICDLDLLCTNANFENGNVVDIVTNGGECSVEVFDASYREIYNETFTVDADTRFYIVQL